MTETVLPCGPEAAGQARRLVADACARAQRTAARRTQRDAPRTLDATAGVIVHTGRVEHDAPIGGAAAEGGGP